MSFDATQSTGLAAVSSEDYAGQKQDKHSAERFYSAPVPASPTHQGSSVGRNDKPGQDDDEDNISDSEDIESEDENERIKHQEHTVEQRRADRRKMKRFRLTHGQTRFLLNEFARQAHPDAAQRERLSKDIPGLTPRQVQVWFQNRRAKLKRLNADDRERIMRSRALPGTLNMAQTLRSSFDTGPQQSYTSTYGAPFSQNPSYYDPNADSNTGYNKPVSLISEFRRSSGDGSITSPINPTSNYTSYYNPEAANVNAENVSLDSPRFARGRFQSLSSQNQGRFDQPTPRSSSFSSGNTPQAPRLNTRNDYLMIPRPGGMESPLNPNVRHSQFHGISPSSMEGTVSESDNGSILGTPVDRGVMARPAPIPYQISPASFSTPTLFQPRAIPHPNLDLKVNYSNPLQTYSSPLQVDPETRLEASGSSSLSNFSANPRLPQQYSVEMPQDSTVSQPNKVYNTNTLNAPQNFQPLNAYGLLGAAGQHDTGQNVGTDTVFTGSVLPSVTNTETGIFYQSEHDLVGRRSATIMPLLAPRNEVLPRQSPPQLSTTPSPMMRILQQQQTQHREDLSSLTRLAGSKRRRDDQEDEESVRASGLRQNMGANKLRKSFMSPDSDQPPSSNGPLW